MATCKPGNHARVWNKSASVAFLLSLCIFFAASCGPNPRIMNSVEEKRDPTSPERPKLTGIEADIEAMRTADFTYIYVLRRKDGDEMSSEDRSFINMNTPVETNRRKLSDSGKAVILGSNFEFEEKVFEALRSRFLFEDLSKSENRPTPAPENK